MKCILHGKTLKEVVETIIYKGESCVYLFVSVLVGFISVKIELPKTRILLVVEKVVSFQPNSDRHFLNNWTASKVEYEMLKTFCLQGIITALYITVCITAP